MRIYPILIAAVVPLALAGDVVQNPSNTTSTRVLANLLHIRNTDSKITNNDTSSLTSGTSTIISSPTQSATQASNTLSNVIPQASVADGTVPVGQVCTRKSECANGADCSLTSLDPKKICGAAGSSCAKDDQCASFSCNQGTCAAEASTSTLPPTTSLPSSTFPVVLSTDNSETASTTSGIASVVTPSTSLPSIVDALATSTDLNTITTSPLIAQISSIATSTPLTKPRWTFTSVKIVTEEASYNATIPRKTVYSTALVTAMPGQIKLHSGAVETYDKSWIITILSSIAALLVIS